LPSAAALTPTPIGAALAANAPNAVVACPDGWIAGAPHVSCCLLLTVLMTPMEFH